MSLRLLPWLVAVSIALGCGGDSGDSSPPPSNTPTGDGAPFVPAIPGGEATYYVSPTGDDGSDGSFATPWRTVTHAATQVVPGDVVEILDGDYEELVTIQSVGTAEAPIVFRSSTGGAHFHGDAITNASDRDVIWLEYAAHVIVHGLEVSGAYRSGFRVSFSPFTVIEGCRVHDNGVWGIFSGYSDDMKVLGNEVWGSAEQHGIYLSNSGDRLVIEGNYVHDNFASGVQINADPVLLMPELGASGDGISVGCVVARNLIVGNGEGGAAGINLASVRSSRIVDNVLHDNLAGGISLWDDAFDPAYGSKNNLVAHNTVVFASGEGRSAVSFVNGSTGNTVVNNLLVGGAGAAVQYDVDSLAGTTMHHNLLESLDRATVSQEADDAEPFGTFEAWVARGFGDGSITGVPPFVDPATDDFTLAMGAAGVDAGAATDVGVDYRGHARSVGAGPDLGAFER